jgi:hypothetical protein
MNSIRLARVALVLVVLVVAVGLAGWWFQSRMATPAAAAGEISPEAAARAEAKLQRLRDRGETVALSETELSSLLHYHLADWAGTLVTEPYVHLAGDRLHLTGRVATARLPSHPELDRIRPLLPDSSQIDIRGRLRPLDAGRAALEVDQVEFARIPIPARFYPDVLNRLGRRDEAGLPDDAIAVPLPPGASSVRIEDDELILIP